jgi:hypothetical protein
MAGAFHDYFNETGRVFVDGRGRRWFGQGDGNLRGPRNQLARRLIEGAARASVRSFLLVFIVGAADDQAMDEIWNRFPVMATGLSREFSCVGQGHASSCKNSAKLGPVSGIQLSAEPSVEFTFGYRGMHAASGYTPIIGTVGFTVWFAGGIHFEYEFGANRAGEGKSQGFLGASAGIERAIFRKFPYPVSASVLVAADCALVTIDPTRPDDLATFSAVRAGAKISLDIGKAWSLAISGGPGYAWSFHDAETPTGRGWWWGASLERVQGTTGGGAR